MSDSGSAGTSGFVTTLVFSSVIGVVALVVFSFLRPRIPTVYLQRDFLQRPTPPLPPPSFFGWIPHVLRLKDDDYAGLYGLEAYMMIRLLRTCALMFGCFALFGLVVLAPVYGTAEGGGAGGINTISLSNVGAGSARFAATVVATYLYSLLLYALLFLDYRAFVVRRVAKLNRSLPAHYNVIVMDLSAGYRSDRRVFSAFDSLTGDVATVRMVRDARAVVKKQEAYERSVAKAERTAYDFEHPKKEKLAGKRPEHRTGKCACCNPMAERVDSIDWHNAKAEYFAERVGAIQSTLDPAYVRRTRSAIVQFRSKTSASLVAQANMWKNTHEWQTARAPEPRAVNWNSLHMDWTTVPPRRVASIAALVALILFWSIPVGFVISLANVQQLSELPGLAWLSFIQDLSPVVVGLIEGVLPIVILNVFLALVPPIMTWIVNWQRHATLVRVDEVVTAYYTAFLIMELFLVVTLFGSFLSEANQLINNPGSIVVDLGTSIPRNANFYMNLLLVNTLTGYTIGLTLVVPVLIRWIKLKFLARTEREVAAANECVGAFKYVVTYSTTLVMAWLALIYSPMTPLISVIAFLFFAFAYVAVKYLLAYVHTEEYFTDGALWFSAFRTMTWAALLMQVVIIATIALNKSWSAAFLAPLPIATLVFGIAMNMRFRPVAEYGGALLQARGGEADEDAKLVGEAGMPEEDERAYIHPGLQPVDEWSRVGPVREETLQEYKEKAELIDRRADKAAANARDKAEAEEEEEEQQQRQRDEEEGRPAEASSAASSKDRQGEHDRDTHRGVGKEEVFHEMQPQAL